MMKADHGIDGVHGMVATRTEDGDALPSHDRETIGIAEAVPPGDLFAALLSGDRGWFHTDAITVRRSAFERAGLFDEDLALSQDWEMWVRLAAVCRLEAGSLEEPIAVRRWHAGNRAREDNPLWTDAACARTSSALRWARTQGLPGRQLQLLRELLVTDIVHRRLGGRTRARRALHVAWRTLRYGLRHPGLPPFVAAEAAREVCRRLPTLSEGSG
jgi:hypothetical protein